MKLLTSIPPRRDGTVIVTAKDGTRCVFEPGEGGELVGEVADELTVAELLNGGMFFPADPADYDKALALSNAHMPGGDDDGDDDTGGAGGSGARDALVGSSNFEPVLDVAGKQVQLGDVVAAAFSASGMTVEAWNALTEIERDDLIEAELDRMAGDAGEDEKPAGGLPLEAGTPPKAPEGGGKGGGKGGAKKK